MKYHKIYLEEGNKNESSENEKWTRKGVKVVNEVGDPIENRKHIIEQT